MGLGMARYLVVAGAKVLVRGWREAELQRVVAELGGTPPTKCTTSPTTKAPTACCRRR